MPKRRSATALMERLFHSRKIIVVSDRGVDYFPVGRGMQIAGVIGILGVVSLVSFATGNYVAAQSQIALQDRKIAQAAKTNQRMTSDFSLLKRDLVKITEEGAKSGMSDYARSVLSQYSAPKPSEGASKGEMVFERIQLLEDRLSKLKTQNDEFVQAIRSVTGKRIGELEQVISLTGLKQKLLEKKLAAKANADSRVAATGAGDEPQGGPYVPYSTEELVDPLHREALDDAGHLMELYSILELLPTGKPVQHYQVTSPFGVRSDPMNHNLARHTGMDFSSPSDPRVHATADGTVVVASYQNAYGNAIDIDHGMGITTRYGHLSRLLVKPGQQVKKGEVIGIEGSTGRSTGTHLHYEVRYNDVPLNPLNFLKAGEYVSKD